MVAAPSGWSRTHYRRGSKRRDRLVVQTGMFMFGVVAVVLLGEYVGSNSADLSAPLTHRGLRDVNHSLPTTAASNSSQNSCGLTWAFDEWA